MIVMNPPGVQQRFLGTMLAAVCSKFILVLISTPRTNYLWGWNAQDGTGTQQFVGVLQSGRLLGCGCSPGSGLGDEQMDRKGQKLLGMAKLA